MLVLYLAYACICCATYVLYLEKSSVCLFVCTPCTCVRVLSLFHLDSIIVGSLERINGLSHFGGVTCFGHLTILKICVHEEYHLELILKDYLVSMWYVILMRNSFSIMYTNYL